MSDESVQVQEMAGALERKVQAVYERNDDLEFENESLKTSESALKKENQFLRDRVANLEGELAARIRHSADVDREIDRMVTQAMQLKRAKDGQRVAPTPQAQPRAEGRPVSPFAPKPALRPVDTTASSADLLRRISEGQ